MNELSENVSFDSEFTLAFEIQPFKAAFWFFLMPIFQSIPGRNRSSKAINNSENILLMGDLNINTQTQTKSDNTNHMTDFSDLFAFSKLVNIKTC